MNVGLVIGGSSCWGLIVNVPLAGYNPGRIWGSGRRSKFGDDGLPTESIWLIANRSVPDWPSRSSVHKRGDPRQDNSRIESLASALKIPAAKPILPTIPSSHDSALRTSASRSGRSQQELPTLYNRSSKLISKLRHFTSS